MERIKLNFPEIIHFSCSINVRVSDVNYGGHLGHDSLISFLHEARNLLFRSFGYSELNVAGAGIILADLAVQYKHEAFNGDELKINCSLANFKRRSVDIFYHVLNNKNQEVAIAKTGIVFFDYNNRKAISVPEEFRKHF